jgi:hypothetical protein
MRLQLAYNRHHLSLGFLLNPETEVQGTCLMDGIAVQVAAGAKTGGLGNQQAVKDELQRQSGQREDGFGAGGGKDRKRALVDGGRLGRGSGPARGSGVEGKGHGMEPRRGGITALEEALESGVPVLGAKPADVIDPLL